MDLAVSWAIVTATRVEENNEAWALASCTNCATRAVAYQVLMTLPGAEVIAPVNAAVAANYECRSCLTEAIAVQLVVSVTGIPSVEAQALIEQAMAKVEALDVQLRTLSAGQIYTILQASQLEIMQILDEDGKIPATAPPTPGPTPEAPPAEAPQGPTAPPTSVARTRALRGPLVRAVDVGAVGAVRAVDVGGAGTRARRDRPRSRRGAGDRTQRARAADERPGAGARTQQ